MRCSWPLVGCHEHRRQRRRAGWSRGNLSGRPRATQSDHVTLVRFLRRLWLSFLSTSLLLLGCRFRAWSTLQATRTSVLSPLRLFMLQRQVSGRNGQYSTSSARSNTVKGEMEEWTSGGREVQAESSREKRWQMGTWGEACNAHVIAAWLHGLGTRSFSFGLLSGSKARLFSENKLKYPRPDQTPSGPVKNQGSVSNREDQSETGSRRRRRRPKQRQRKGKVIKDDGFETWHPAIQGSSGERDDAAPTADRRSEIKEAGVPGARW